MGRTRAQRRGAAKERARAEGRELRRPPKCNPPRQADGITRTDTRRRFDDLPAAWYAQALPDPESRGEP